MAVFKLLRHMPPRLPSAIPWVSVAKAAPVAAAPMPRLDDITSDAPAPVAAALTPELPPTVATFPIAFAGVSYATSLDLHDAFAAALHFDGGRLADILLGEHGSVETLHGLFKKDVGYSRSEMMAAIERRRGPSTGRGD